MGDDARSLREEREARDLFGAQVAAAIGAQERVAEVRYDPEEFKVVLRKHDDTSEGTLFLANAFRDRADLDEEGRRAQIERLARWAVPEPVPEDWNGVRAMLRPVLRRADFGMASGAAPGLSRPAMHCLSEFVVIDTDEAMSYVLVRDLAKWGVTADDVFSAAHANLTDQFRSLLDKRPDTPTAISFVGLGHTCFGSLPLLEDWLAGWAADWGGVRPLVFLTDQSGMLIVPEPDDPAGVIPLLATAEQEWTEATRPISPAAYTVDDDARVVPYDVPYGHPARTAVRHSWSLLTPGVYHSQTERLRAAAEPGAPFAAALQRFTRPQDGTSFTVATWGEGEPALLPQADWVAFAGDGDPVFVPWEAVAAEAGLAPEPGYHPTRYLVNGWPEPHAMARIREQASRP
jgi:hypothetical protein